MTGAFSLDDLPNLAAEIRELAELFEPHRKNGKKLNGHEIGAIADQLQLIAAIAERMDRELHVWRSLGPAIPQPGALQ